MTCGIYFYWDNEKDALAYIGQSVNIEKRHLSHLSPSTYDDQPFNRILQNNKDRYELFILLECDENDLLYQEDLAIVLYKPLFNYRLNGGKYRTGENHIYYGKKRPEISKRMSGKNHPFYGKHHTEEARNKISQANKNRIAPQEERENMSRSRNTSGYLFVTKKNDKTVKQGFSWCYRYTDNNGKRRALTSVDIEKLKNKVIERGLIWEKI